MKALAHLKKKVISRRRRHQLRIQRCHFDTDARRRWDMTFLGEKNREESAGCTKPFTDKRKCDTKMALMIMATR